ARTIDTGRASLESSRASPHPQQRDVGGDLSNRSGSGGRESGPQRLRIVSSDRPSLCSALHPDGFAARFCPLCNHWAEHHVPILWRMHQVHHSDPDFDLSTGARVHPLEAVLVQGATLGAVVLLAPPVAAVLAVELVTCFQVFFAHANVSMTVGVEKYLRRVWVTPEMHRVHHSEDAAEQGRNLSDIFPCRNGCESMNHRSRLP